MSKKPREVTSSICNMVSLGKIIASVQLISKIARNRTPSGTFLGGRIYSPGAELAEIPSGLCRTCRERVWPQAAAWLGRSGMGAGECGAGEGTQEGLAALPTGPGSTSSKGLAAGSGPRSRLLRGSAFQRPGLQGQLGVSPRVLCCPPRPGFWSWRAGSAGPLRREARWS